MNRTLGLLLLLTLISCVPKQATQASAQITEAPYKSCETESSADPKNIHELVNLINSLPKPLDAACLIKSLKRPLYVNATSSILSAQPAGSSSSPRIFIFKGDLIISVVPSGEGAKLLEFSEMTSSMRSIKRELHLPIEKNISYSDPFAGIITQNKTSCSGCHSGERAEYAIDGVTVFSSVALKPGASRDVPVETLNDFYLTCQLQKNTLERCQLFNELFGHGEVLAQEFSDDMTLFINTFGR